MSLVMATCSGTTAASFMMVSRPYCCLSRRAIAEISLRACSKETPSRKRPIPRQLCAGREAGGNVSSDQPLRLGTARDGFGNGSILGESLQHVILLAQILKVRVSELLGSAFVIYLRDAHDLLRLFVVQRPQ